MLLFLLSFILVYHGVLITLNFSDGCDTINWEALEQVCIITLFMYFISMALVVRVNLALHFCTVLCNYL